jgi:hypothetical protein
MEGVKRVGKFVIKLLAIAGVVIVETSLDQAVRTFVSQKIRNLYKKEDKGIQVKAGEVETTLTQVQTQPTPEPVVSKPLDEVQAANEPNQKTEIDQTTANS